MTSRRAPPPVFDRRDERVVSTFEKISVSAFACLYTHHNMLRVTGEREPSASGAPDRAMPIGDPRGGRTRRAVTRQLTEVGARPCGMARKRRARAEERHAQSPKLHRALTCQSAQSSVVRSRREIRLTRMQNRGPSSAERSGERSISNLDLLISNAVRALNKLLKAPDRLPSTASWIRCASGATVQMLRVLVSENLLAATKARPHDMIVRYAQVYRSLPVLCFGTEPFVAACRCLERLCRKHVSQPNQLREDPSPRVVACPRCWEGKHHSAACIEHVL